MRVLSALLLVAVSAGLHIDAARAVSLDTPIVTGSRLYTPQQLVAATGPFIGQQMSPALIERITSAIETLYRTEGYVVPLITPIAATLTTSTPRFHVVDATIVEVSIRGDAGPYQDTIRQRALVLENTTIHKASSRRILADIEALPGLRLNARFEPQASDASRFVLILDVSYDAIVSTVYANNRGTEDLGPMMFGGRVRMNGVLGAGETLALSAFASDSWNEYHFIGASVDRRFGRIDSSFDASTSHARPSADANFSTQRASVQFKSTVHDSGSMQIAPVLAFGMRDSAGRDDQRREFSSQRTRFTELGLIMQMSGSSSSTRLSSNVTQGLDALGADASSRYAVPTDLSFTKLSVDVAHVRAIAANWNARVDAEGQWSGDHLPFGERFTFGGARFGRAFDPATLIGYSGASASAQLERVMRWRGQWVRSARAYLQTDYGFVSDSPYGSDDAASVTLGIATQVSSVQTSIELSQSVLNPQQVTVSSGPRAFVNMQMTF